MYFLLSLQNFSIQFQQLRSINVLISDSVMERGSCCNNKLINTTLPCNHPSIHPCNHLSSSREFAEHVPVRHSHGWTAAQWSQTATACAAEHCKWSLIRLPTTCIRSAAAALLSLSLCLFTLRAQRTRCVCVIWLAIARVSWRALGEPFCFCVSCFDCDYFGHMEESVATAFPERKLKCSPYEIDSRRPGKI